MSFDAWRADGTLALFGHFGWSAPVVCFRVHLMMKILTVARVFAFVLFLFVPAISVMLFAGFVLHSTYWFKWLGLPVLLVNGAILFVQPIKSLIGLQLIKMGRGG
jgi:hypothetical protein